MSMPRYFPAPMRWRPTRPICSFVRHASSAAVGFAQRFISMHPRSGFHDGGFACLPVLGLVAKPMRSPSGYRRRQMTSPASSARPGYLRGQSPAHGMTEASLSISMPASTGWSLNLLALTAQQTLERWRSRGRTLAYRTEGVDNGANRIVQRTPIPTAHRIRTRSSHAPPIVGVFMPALSRRTSRAPCSRVTPSDMPSRNHHNRW